MFCRNCGTKNQAVALFCKNCGHSMDTNNITAHNTPASTQNAQPNHKFPLLESVKRVFFYIGEIILSLIVSLLVLYAVGWVIVYFAKK
ncbi:hypothetical protein AADEFJLK_00018 [Methylovulum psychrotolerans]|uniref:Zinc-ribbon domain-containing protein n=2 Tax=Methylovulum psychrotolerans TaxID=1704499 RepID=A0A2S5CQB0_9GAMM|nr:hypothetical protein AADEFJLK_00018 [Methylovulum psychrotolerans]